MFMVQVRLHGLFRAPRNWRGCNVDSSTGAAQGIAAWYLKQIG
jgi:hypothetical protein